MLIIANEIIMKDFQSNLLSIVLDLFSIDIVAKLDEQYVNVSF